MPDKDSLQQAEVTIVDACCCYYDGFLFGDGCLGCMGSTTMCCLEEEFCCKQGADPLCLYCCACRMVPVSVLIKGQGQTCCCVGGVAIPPDSEVPCMIGTLGVVCYPSFGVCKKMKDITGSDPNAGGGGEQVG